jgi:RNA polymerase sigma factor (sigma-70 family)
MEACHIPPVGGHNVWMAAPVPTRDRDVPDAVLLRAYVGQGNQDAFAVLVDRHINLVFSAARRMMRNRHDAEDVTQAVFLILARRAARIDPHVILPAWLYRTTLFLCKDARRAQFRRTRREMASATPSTGTAHDEAGTEPQWIELLDLAMTSLGESDRTLLILRYFQGQSVSEIAATLHVSPNSTSKRLERAVGRLRRFFERQGVALSGSALAAGLASNAVGTAPAGLSVAVAQAATGAANVAAAASAHALAKGALLAMKTSMQIKSALFVTAVILALLCSAGAVYYVVFGIPNPANPTQTIVLSGVPSAARPVQVPPPPAPVPRADLPEYLPGGTIPVLAAPSRKGDRGLGQSIEAEFFDEGRGVNVVAPGISGFSLPNFARYDNVDFGSSSPTASAADPAATDFFANIACPADLDARLEVKVDDLSAAPICTLKVARNGGIPERNAQRASLTRPVRGQHTVYLMLSGKPGISAINLDWFKFVSLPRPATRRIDAVQFDAMRGAAVTDAGVAHLDTGDFLRYSAVDFGRGAGYVHVNCGVRTQYAGRSIVFRIDDVNGPIIAQLKVRDTGEFSNFEVQTASVDPVKGLHDVYLTFNGNGVANIEWFQFSSDSKPPPPVPTTAPSTKRGDQ